MAVVAGVAAVTPPSRVLQLGLDDAVESCPSHLVDRYSEVFRSGLDNPDFLNPAKTRNYEHEWPSNTNKRGAYEAYARLCWSHAPGRRLRRKFLWVFFRRRFKRQYCNALETSRRLHRVWLEELNATFFPGRGFHRFVREVQVAQLEFDPRTADQLRWNNEIEDYDETVLQPLGVADNPLLQHVDQIEPDAGKLVVADVGCGNGRLYYRAASEGHAKVHAVDGSEAMLEAARVS